MFGEHQGGIAGVAVAKVQGTFVDPGVDFGFTSKCAVL